MKTKWILSLAIFFTSMSLYAQEIAVTASGDSIYVYMDGTWTYEIRTAEDSLMFEEEEEEPVVWTIDTSYAQFFSSESADKKIMRPVDFYTIDYVNKLWLRIPPASLHPNAAHAFRFKKGEVQAFLIADTADVGLEQAFRSAMEKIQENPATNLEVTLSELRTLNNTDMIFADYTIDAGETSFRFNTYFYSGPEGTIQYNAYAPVDVYDRNSIYIEEMLSGLTVISEEEETKDQEKGIPVIDDSSIEE